MPKRNTKRAAANNFGSELKDLLADPKPTDLNWRHQVGKLIRDCCPDRAYGEGRIGKLQKSLPEPGWCVAELRKMRGFAIKYSEEDVKRLLGPFKNGIRFRWTHISCLVALDAENRVKLQKQCQEEGWPAEYLRERIRSKLGKGKRSQGGRKHKSADEAVLQLVREMDDRLQRFQKVWFKEDDENGDLLLLIGQSSAW